MIKSQNWIQQPPFYEVEDCGKYYQGGKSAIPVKHYQIHEVIKINIVNKIIPLVIMFVQNGQDIILEMQELTIESFEHTEINT